MATVFRSYLTETRFDLRNRVSYRGCFLGNHNVGGSQIDTNFLILCDNWFRDFNVFSTTYRGITPDWIGHVGFCATNRVSFHNGCRAMDLTAIGFTNGDLFDMNLNWRDNTSCTNVFYIRTYIAVAALLRRHMKTVLTAWFNTDHHNHIHADNGGTLNGIPPILQNTKTDTTLIQAVGRHMMGLGTSIDGIWGNQTQSHYLEILRRLRLQCTNPKGNTGDAVRLLGLIAANGMQGGTDAIKHNC